MQHHWHHVTPRAHDTLATADHTNGGRAGEGEHRGRVAGLERKEEVVLAVLGRARTCGQRVHAQVLLAARVPTHTRPGLDDHLVLHRLVLLLEDGITVDTGQLSLYPPRILLQQEQLAREGIKTPNPWPRTHGPTVVAVVAASPSAIMICAPLCLATPVRNTAGESLAIESSRRVNRCSIHSMAACARDCARELPPPALLCLLHGQHQLDTPRHRTASPCTDARASSQDRSTCCSLLASHCTTRCAARALSSSCSISVNESRASPHTAQR